MAERFADRRRRTWARFFRMAADISYTLKQIHRIPHNISAWNYLRGYVSCIHRVETSLIDSLLKHLKKPYTSILPAIAIYTDKIISTDSSSTLPMPSDPLPKDTPLPISYALEFYADSLLEQSKREEAAEVFAQLGHEVDRIRASYWNYRRKECLQ